MNDNELVIEVLEEAYPVEVEIVGPSNVRYIANGREFVQAPGGNYLDLQTFVVSLTAAAALIKIILEIYILLKRHSPEKPNASQVKKELELRDTINQAFSGTELDRLIVIILSKVD